MLIRKYEPKRKVRQAEDDIKTVPEVGALLGLTPGGAYAMARRGELDDAGLFHRGRRKYVWMPTFRQKFPEAKR